MNILLYTGLKIKQIKSPHFIKKKKKEKRKKRRFFFMMVAARTPRQHTQLRRRNTKRNDWHNRRRYRISTEFVEEVEEPLNFTHAKAARSSSTYTSHTLYHAQPQEVKKRGTKPATACCTYVYPHMAHYVGTHLSESKHPGTAMCSTAGALSFRRLFLLQVELKKLARVVRPRNLSTPF